MQRVYEWKDYDWFRENCGGIVLRVYRSGNAESEWKRLTDDEQLMFILGQFVTIYRNGGLESYLRSPEAFDLEALLRGLRRSNCLKLADQLRVAFDQVFPSGYPEDQLDRENEIESFLADSEVRILDDLFPVELETDVWSNIRNAFEMM